MPVPKQVAQDLKDLEAYEKDLQDRNKPPETEDNAASPDNTQVSEPDLTAEPAPLKVVETPPEDSWERKYQTLKGKYDAEVPRLHSQVKELSTQVTKLIQDVDKAKTPPKPEPAAVEPLVSAKDVESFGEDLIDVQRRVAKEVMAPLQAELSKRDEKIAQLEEALSRTGGEVATVGFEQKLNSQIPDFSEINASPRWIAWLDETDPYTSEPRRGYAEFVYNNGDVAKLKKVVDFYKATVLKAKPTTPNPADKDAERRQRNAELERQVTPTRNTSQTSTTPANTRIYTEPEMEQLFGRVRQLNTTGKYEEAVKLEAELTEAYMQGRVRPS